LYLILFAVLCHEAFVVDVGEEEAFVDDDVSGILVEGGVGGALIGVPFPTHMGIAAYWGLVLKCYELRTRQHKVLNVDALRPTKHYSLKD
jgi:hypothetical protein